MHGVEAHLRIIDGRRARICTLLNNQEILAGMVSKCSREYVWVELDNSTDGPSSVLAKPVGRLELRLHDERRLALASRNPELVTARQLAVGDRVEVQAPPSADTSGLWQVIALLPRETWLIRRSEGRYRLRPQLVVANADQLAVVAAPNPSLRIGTIDRYFLAALQGGLTPLLVVNKLDLSPELSSSPELLGYQERGYRVYFTSAVAGYGLSELQSDLAGRLTVFCGHSGVGKSSLLSRLTGQPLRTGEVRQRDMKGRQTTVTAEAFRLPEGGHAVDTPGVREYGLAYLSWLDLNEYFSDIAAIGNNCAYSNCSHSVEPRCAVRSAAASGHLSEQRLASYRRLRAELDSSQQAH